MNLKGLLILAILIVASLAYATIDPSLAQYPLPQDPAVVSGRLPNGLKYFVQQNSVPAGKVELRLMVNAGSICEDDDQRGLAHFTEHMLFNGTRSFPKSEMIDFLNSVGMGYMNGLNGMTSYDYTVYMFSLPTRDQEVLQRGFLLLSEMAHAANFDPIELEKERGVIIEEWRMGQNADSRVRERTNEINFQGSRYTERSPIGTYDVLSTFTREQILRFYNDWYRPDLQTVVVVGDISPEAAVELITDYFGVIPARENPRERMIYPVPGHDEPRSVIATDPELNQSTVQVNWKRDPYSTQTLGDYYADIRRNLFYDMINSRLGEINRQASPPFLAAYAYEYAIIQPLTQVSLIAMIGDNQAETALFTLLTEVERIRQYGFTLPELQRAKQSLVRRYENALAEQATRESGRITWNFMAPAFNGDAILSPEQEYALASTLIPEVSLEECNQMINQMIGSRNQVISVQAVQKANVAYPNPEALLALANRMEGTELTPYEDNSSDEPILAEIPAPGTITEEISYPGSGIKRWKLSNGITIYLKKTDFRADEIRVVATSPGGYSQISENDLVSARMLNSYLSEAGIGNLDPVQLERTLSGHIVSLDTELGRYSEGFSGSCSPNDLETFFQLIYQYSLAPRWNQDNLSSVINRNIPIFENRSLDPETAFFDTLWVVSKTISPYNRNLYASDLPGVNLDALSRIHADRFGDFSDFNFFIIGNFDEAALRNLSTIYLANLPAARRADIIPDLGIRPVMGHMDVIFEKGGADKSYVGLITNGLNTTNPDDNVQREAMLMVLNEKLRENIREERSGVYFVQAVLSTEKYPYPYYTLQTIMSCSADRVDELSDAIIATMDSLKAGLFDDKYVDTARVTLLQSHTQSIRQNRYWLSNMVTSVRNGRPIDQFLDNPRRYQSISKQSIIASARKYLATDQSLIKLVMMPARSNQ